MIAMVKFRFVAAAAITLAWISAGNALAHCDSLDGPVVTKAREALAKKDVTPVLPWVAEEDEGKIRQAFEMAIAVRERGGKERELADRFFFETLVRVHRAGEGAPFTGLKPAGLDRGAAILAADRSLETESPKAVLELIEQTVLEGIRTHYAAAVAKKEHAEESVEAGRDYVRAYVSYVHYVERLYHDASLSIAHDAEVVGEREPARPGPTAAPTHGH